MSLGSAEEGSTLRLTACAFTGTLRESRVSDGREEVLGSADLLDLER